MRNVERVARTRAALIASGKTLFAERGFADTSTEALLKGAQVTRGALYHHFTDKAALFEAVCIALSEDAMAAIARAVAGVEEPLLALEQGSLAWIDFVLQPEARRILLVEGPSVLGWQRWMEIDAAHSFRLLCEGVAIASGERAIHFAAGPEALAVLLNGAMNAIALRLGSKPGALDRETGRAAVRELIGAFAAR